MTMATTTTTREVATAIGAAVIDGIDDQEPLSTIRPSLLPVTDRLVVAGATSAHRRSLLVDLAVTLAAGAPCRCRTRPCRCIGAVLIIGKDWTSFPVPCGPVDSRPAHAPALLKRLQVLRTESFSERIDYLLQIGSAPEVERPLGGIVLDVGAEASALRVSTLVAMSLDTAHSFSGGQDQLKHKLPSVVIGMEQALPRHVLSFASPFTTVTLQPTSSKTLSVGGQEFTAGNRRYTLACEDQGEAIVWENATAHGGM